MTSHGEIDIQQLQRINPLTSWRSIDIQGQRYTNISSTLEINRSLVLPKTNTYTPSLFSSVNYALRNKYLRKLKNTCPDKRRTETYTEMQTRNGLILQILKAKDYMIIKTAWDRMIRKRWHTNATGFSCKIIEGVFLKNANSTYDLLQLSTAVGQAVACTPVTQRARVRSQVGTSFLGEIFSGFSSPVRQMSGIFSPQGPRISFGHHYHHHSSFITGANDLIC